MDLNNFEWVSTKVEDDKYITITDEAVPLYKMDIEINEVAVRKYSPINDIDEVIKLVDDFCDNEGYEMYSFLITTKYDKETLKVLQHSAECKFIKIE